MASFKTATAHAQVWRLVGKRREKKLAGNSVHSGTNLLSEIEVNICVDNEFNQHGKFGFVQVIGEQNVGS